MQTIIDTRAPLPTLVINHNSDWSGAALLLVGVGAEQRRFTIDAYSLLLGRAGVLMCEAPIEIIIRATAVAARAHALQQARAALDDL